MNLPRPLLAILYGGLIGLCLATYIAPLQRIFETKEQISTLQARLKELEEDTAYQQQLIRDLGTPAGIERVARERYGMIYPGERVYIIPEEDGGRQ